MEHETLQDPVQKALYQRNQVISTTSKDSRNTALTRLTQILNIMACDNYISYSEVLSGYDNLLNVN